MVRRRGLDPDRLRISANAHLIMPYHRKLDADDGALPRQEQDRHHQEAGSGLPTPTSTPATASGSRICTTPGSSARRWTGPWRTRTGSFRGSTTNCPWMPRRSPTSTSDTPIGSSPTSPTPPAVVGGSAGGQDGAAGGCSGNTPRRRPRNVSVRHLVQPDRRRGVGRGGDRASKDRRESSGSPRPTSPGSAPGPSPPSYRTRPGIA